MTTTATFTPLTTSKSRVFLIEGRARPDHTPSYESCLRMTGLSQGFGDVEKIECPDPYQYGKFIEVGQIKGATERVTTSLEGRYAIEFKSDLLKLARQGCSLDVQLHLGICQDPSAFNSFEKILVVEKVYLTNYGTDDLGALASGDDAAVNETADISGESVYEVVPITFGEKAGTIVTNEVLDVAICDSISCGDCGTDSDGCKKIFAITASAGGSAGTPPDVIFSIDKGVTWYAHDIDSMIAAEDPTGVDCVGSYLVVVSNETNSLHYALLTEFDGTTDPDFTEVTTGFVSGGEPNAIWGIGNEAWIAGDAGYIYWSDDVITDVTAIEAGTATADDLYAIHGYSPDFVVAVGGNGAVIYTENGTSFAAATRPVGVGVNLNCVWVKSELEWWVGSSAGNLYYTLNGGSTWTAKAFPGSGTGRVDDIVFSTASVGYLAHATATPRGRVLRTYDGGNTWVITPERTGASMPLNDRVNALAVCDFDPNFVVGVGLADNGSDGFVVVGS